MNQDSLYLRLFYNKTQSLAKKIKIDTSQLSLVQLKSICGQLLGMQARRLFLEDGAEVRGLGMLYHNAIIYVSEGEEYELIQQYKTSTQQSRSNKSSLSSRKKDSLKSSLDLAQALSMEVALLGASAVGKSSIVARFLGRPFPKQHLPTIEDKHTKVKFRHNQQVLLNLLDTSGDPAYQSIQPQWLRFKDALLLIYDANQYSTFLALWDYLKLYEAALKDVPPLVFVVANQVEQESIRQVSAQKGQELAEQFRGQYWEVSAKENINIQGLFDRILECFCDAQLRMSHYNSIKTSTSEFSHSLEHGHAPCQEQPSLLRRFVNQFF